MLQNFRTLDLFKIAKLFSVFTFAVLFAFPASAQFADSPCDTDYFESLEARAWLEAQREITQNQNLITKPDSVLEYTCYDRHMSELAEHAQQMFSETTRWGTILPSNSMDEALTNLAGSAMSSYISSNFSHSFLGGRSGTDYSPSSSISGGSYSCDMMQQVWQEAKCTNFGAEDHDGFFTLQQYVDDPDKRQLPTACTKPGGWSDNMETALTDTPWEEDPVETDYDTLFPTSSTCPGSEHIRTGLVVRQTKSTPEYFFEHVCIVPGCFWEPSGSGTASTPSPGGDCASPS